MPKPIVNSEKTSGKKRARPVEPSIDWNVSGTRCIGIEGIEGEPLCVFAKAADVTDPKARQVVVFAESDTALSAALEGIDGCEIVYSSKRDGNEMSSGAAHGMQWCLLSFDDSKAAKRFLRLPPPQADENDDDAAPTGLRAWLSTHQRASSMDPRALQASVDRYMIAFDEQEEQVEQATNELEARMEADGFTLVTKKGAKGHAAIPTSTLPASSGTGAGVGVTVSGRYLSDNQKRKLKRGSLAHEDFYRFQALGAKIDALADLRAKFAQDRERISRMKDGRVFKPT